MKVLIATDGSPFSLAAIEKCADLITNTADTEIKVMSVYEKLGPMAGEPFGVATDYYREAESSARLLAEQAVTEAVDAIRKRFPDMKFTISTEVDRGRAARVIVEAAAEWKADMIVMGSHGHGFWARNLLGSVSDAVVHHAPCSVFVVRSGQQAE
jgi:nucleotide-binding universal stress UspA family protein